ncbi:MAG TPA: LysR family transcriptional regulator [Pseudomonas sp.]|jgi:DNA-binding transcriptional LysR family regulator|uniref:LysR family transcriptional regulator n=1 Tax=Pseudomonas sp. TaxID=306 RepID=UPI002ED7A7EC
MLDLELLKTFVCVIDEGSFTRAAERVHRTQSTVSQQVRKLEEVLGQPLLLRDRTGSQLSLTEHGAVLLPYARRLLALASEAEEALLSEVSLESLRLGVPEDFDALRMTSILAGFNHVRPGVRLETISGMSIDLRHKLAIGDIDIALVKREPGAGPSLASWPEELVWVKGKGVELGQEAVPLALFPQGCLYRQRAIRALDSIQRRWRLAFGSHSLTGIQAAVAGGLGISLLPASAVLPQHVICREMPAVPPSEMALLSTGATLNAAQLALVGYLREALG